MVANRKKKETFRQWPFWLIFFTAVIVFLVLVSDILLPFVVGLLVAYFLDPAADKLETFGLSRTTSTLTIISLFFVSAIAIISLLAPTITDQLIELAKKVPEYIRLFQKQYSQFVGEKLGAINPEWSQSLKKATEGISGDVIKISTIFIKNIWTSGVALLNLLSLIFISPIVAFYLLRDWDRMIEKIDKALPRKHASVIRTQAKQIDNTLSAYIRGQSNVCLLLGIFYAISLSIAGLDFGLIIGLGTGILSFIPYVGMVVGMAIGLLVAFFQFGEWIDVGIILAIFILGQFLEGNFVTPKLVGEKVGLHPVWVIFALLAGGALFGFVGILIAIPVAAVAGVLIRFLFQKYLSGKYYKGNF